MREKLKVAFCILAALGCAAAIPLYCFLGWVALVIDLAATLVFVLFMFLCKKGRQEQETPSSPDYFHPKDPSDRSE